MGIGARAPSSCAATRFPALPSGCRNDQPDGLSSLGGFGGGAVPSFLSFGSRSKDSSGSQAASWAYTCGSASARMTSATLVISVNFGPIASGLGVTPTGFTPFSRRAMSDSLR